MSPERLPVVSVTLTEDRATVVRRGTIDHATDAQTLVVRGLSPLVVNDSVQIEVDHPGVKVARWALSRQWHQPDNQAAITGIHPLLDDLETDSWRTNGQLQRSAARLRDAARRLTAWKQAADTAGMRGHARPEQVEAGLQHGVDRVLESVDQMLDRTNEADDLQRKIKRISGADDGQRGQPSLSAELQIHLSGAAPEETGAIQVTVRYLVPSALWRPSYEAELVETDTGTELVLRLVAAAWQRTGEHWEDVSLLLSTARPGASSTLPELSHDVLRAQEKSRSEARQIDASFRNQAIDSASLTKGGDEQVLPGVDDGGEVREFRPERRITLPSDGRARRVVVAELRSPAETARRVVPARLAAVVHIATAQNTLSLPGAGPMPLLAGPVLLVRGDGTCVGTGKLPFVAPGERFKLGFGSEDDVLVEHAHGRRVETRFARGDRVWFTSTTTLTSMSAEAIELEVIDRVPVSELDEVTVEVAPSPSGPPRAGPDEQGFVRWSMRLAPGQQLQLEVAFAIEKPDRVQLPDPW